MASPRSVALALLVLAAPVLAQEGRVTQISETTHPDPTVSDPSNTVEIQSWHRRATFSQDGQFLVMQELPWNTFSYHPTPDARPRTVVPGTPGLSMVELTRQSDRVASSVETWQFYTGTLPAIPIGLMPQFNASGDRIFIAKADPMNTLARLYAYAPIPTTVSASDPALTGTDGEAETHVLWFISSPTRDEVFYLAQAYVEGVASYLGVFRLDLATANSTRLLRIDRTVDLAQFLEIDSPDDLAEQGTDWSMAVSADGDRVAVTFGGSTTTDVWVLSRDGADSFQATLPAGMLNLYLGDMAFLPDGRHLALSMTKYGLSFIETIELGVPLSASRLLAPMPLINRGTPFSYIVSMTGLPDGRLLMSAISLGVERSPEGAPKTKLYNDLVVARPVFVQTQGYLEAAAVVVPDEGTEVVLPVTWQDLQAAIQAAIAQQSLEPIYQVAVAVGQAVLAALQTMDVKIDVAASRDGMTAAYSVANPTTVEQMDAFVVDLRALADADPAAELVCGFGDLGSEQNPSGNVQVFGGAAEGFAPFDWTKLAWAGYNQANGETHVATGDVDGDGEDELVIGIGAYSPNGGWFQVRDDRAHGYATMAWRRLGWSLYQGANGAIYPQCGDTDGDGRDEIVLGLGQGAYGWFVVRDDARTGFAPIGWQFVRWSTYRRTGGPTRPAFGDVDGDGRDEIVVGLGDAGQGYLEVFDDVRNLYRPLTWIRSGRTSTRPACGNLDGDAADEVLIGRGAAEGGRVEAKEDALAAYRSLATLQVAQGSIETRVASGDVNGDGLDEAIVGFGPGGAGRIAVYADATRAFAPLGAATAGTAAYNSANGETWPAAGDVR